MKEDFRETIRKYMREEGSLSPQELIEFNEQLNSMSKNELLIIIANLNWDEEGDDEFGMGGDWWKNSAATDR